jgi:hypothetical protein
MSLKAFHILFVALSSLLCFGFAGWNIHRYQSGGGAGTLALGLGALGAGVALLVYGRWFWRKITTRDEEMRRRRKNIRKLPVALGAIVAGHVAQPGAWACTSCFGGAEGPMIDGARLGVYLLFAFVLLMQLSFGSFFVYLWRRARRFKALD